MKKKKLWIWLPALLITLQLLYSCQDYAKNFSDSEILYRGKCSSCHNLIEPGRFDKETWHLYIDKYGQEMTEEEKQSLLDYLTESMVLK